MKPHWWSCVFGLLCMPAEVILSNWKAVQKPLTVSQVTVNSSIEIMCSTSLLDPLGLSLHRQFKQEKQDYILYLSFENRVLQRTTTDENFKDRIHINQEPGGHGLEFGFTLQLSLLRPEDTDLYYCRWSYSDSEVYSLDSKGTVVIVRERIPQDRCEDPTLDFTFISLSAVALTIILSIFIGALIMSCRKFRNQFTPARAARPPRPDRPRHICPPQPPQPYSYLITYGNRTDFRGIL